MTLRVPRSVPEDHRAYDETFLRAVLQGPLPDTMTYMCENPSKNISNPWFVPWHIAPKMRRTECSIDDFCTDLRARLERVIPAGECSGAQKLLQHLSHVTIQHATELHCGRMTPDELCTAVRNLLKSVFHPQGVFIMESPAHPFWKEGGRDVQLSKGGTPVTVRIAWKKPTTGDRALARFLAEPNLNIAGPDGRIAEYLRETRPELLSIDDCNLIRYSSDLRRDIRRLLSGDAPFDTALRQEILRLITDEWMRVMPRDEIRNLDSHVEDSQMPTQDFIGEYFPPNVIADRAAFLGRRQQLEERTILETLEHANEEKNPDAAREHAALWKVWEQAMMRHKLSLCDHPTLSLAFLAGSVTTSGTKKELLHYL